MPTENLLLLQQHLDRVSRSFALCIRQLQSPFRDWVSLSYVLCRQLDTIEDTSWPSAKDRDYAFSCFERFLQQEPDPSEVKKWVKSFPKETSPGEQLLLSDSGLFFEQLHDLDDHLKNTIRSRVLMMCSGMRHFLQGGGRELRLKSLPEVNQYCFFVAGIVGELLTHLFVEYKKGSFTASAEIHKNAYHFGLFLQKINLLKDKLEDERVGRYLVPDPKLVRESIRINAVSAFSYIRALPVEDTEYRLFCAWSLLLGLASLPIIENNWLRKLAEKIPRARAIKLFDEISSVVHDNEKLEEMFYRFLPDESAEVHLPLSNLRAVPWLEAICPAVSPFLGELGLLP